MKILLLFLSIIALTSCSNDCESQISAATKQYKTAIQYAGGSTQAIQKIQQEYNQKINQIYSECK